MVIGLDIAAGIAGLITLADVVINRTYKTIQACRNAGSESQRLLKEVQSLLGILTGLKSLANEAARGSLDSYIPAEEILNCQRTLTRVRDKLVKANPDESGISPASKLKRMLKWPFSSKEMDEVLKALERYKTTFDLSVSLDTLEAVLNASSEQVKLASGIEQIQKSLADISRVQLTEKKRKTLEFFGSFDAESSYSTNTRLRKAGTGLWLTKGPEFTNWLSTQNSKLWMYGIPGAGKTVLAAAAINETLNYASPEYGVAYYHCDYKNPQSQRLDRILGCLCGQLSRQSDACFDRLSKMYCSDTDQSPRRTYPSEEELISLLSQLAIHFDEVAVIVDGVDECENAGLVARVLSDLALRCETVRLLMASRDEVDIRGHLEDFEHLSIAARSDDLKLYVSSEIQERIQNGALKIRSVTLKDEILDKLVNGAEGMFRWVACQMDHLCELPTDSARRKALLQLPRGLYETYDRILARVNTSSEATRTLVERVLKWLFEDADLSNEALCEAVAIEQNGSQFDRDAQPDVETILSCCSSLIRRVVVAQEGALYRRSLGPHFSRGEKLELAHFTVKEYLGSEQLLASPRLTRYFCSQELVDAYRATTSLRYLCLEDLKDAHTETYTEYKELCATWQFYDYAAHDWPSYLQRCDTATEATKLATSLFCERKTAFNSWKRTYACEDFGHGPSTEPEADVQDVWDKIKNVTADAEPQHCAAMLDLPMLIKQVHERGYDVNKRSTLGTPLHLALQCGETFSDAVRSLDGRKSRRRRVFSMMRDEELNQAIATVKALVEYGADVNDKIFWNSLCSRQEDGPCSVACVACQHGSLPLASLLFDAGACVDRHLIKAQMRRLQSMASPRSQDLFSKLIPLLSSQEIAEEDRQLFSLLQAHQTSKSAVPGLDLSGGYAEKTALASGDVENSLMWACEADNLEFFEQLHALYSESVTRFAMDKLLRCAVGHVSPRLVQRLLELGVDVNSLGEKGDAPIHIAARTHHRAYSNSSYLGASSKRPTRDYKSLFRILMSKGADPGLHSRDGHTPLHLIAMADAVERLADFASCLPRDEMSALLLSPDSAGLLPLHVAASHGCLETFNELRSIEPAAEARRSDGRTLVHFAVRSIRRSTAILSTLLHSGTDAAAQAEDGSTAAHDCIEALEVYHRQTSQSELNQSNLKGTMLDLVSHGCDVGRARADRKTPLTMLCELIASYGFCNTQPVCECEQLLGCANILLGHTRDLTAKNDSHSILSTLLEAAYRVDSEDGNQIYISHNRIGLALLERLLEVSVNLEVKDLCRGTTSALGVAALLGKESLAMRLIEHGCNVDAQDFMDGPNAGVVTPLQRLCLSAECVNAVEAALKRTCDLKQLNSNGWSLLHLAASSDSHHSSAVVDLLIDTGIPIDMVGGLKQWTALMIAASRSSTEVIKSLLTRGANPSIRSHAGWTAFTLACSEGSADAIHLLFDADASWDFVRLPIPSTDTINARERTVGPIQIAACGNDAAAALEALLQMEAKGCERLQYSKGPSPLWLCCLTDKTAAARILISNGFDVDAFDPVDRTNCLQVAASTGSIGIIEMLLEANCDLNAKDVFRRSALDHAILANQKQAVALLSKSSVILESRKHVASKDSSRNQRTRDFVRVRELPSPEILMELIKQGDLASIKRLHFCGTNLSNRFDCNACTPLLIALVWDQRDIAAYLLDQQVSIDGRTCRLHTEQSSTCLELAAVSTSGLSILATVLRVTLSPRWRSDRRVNRLLDMTCVAAHGGNLAALQELLKTGPLQDISAVIWSERTHVVHIPTIKPDRSSSPARSTSSRGTSYERRETNFVSSLPLLAAVEGNQLEAVSALLAAGADVNIADQHLWTALHFATDMGYDRMVQMLLDHGSDPNLRTRNGLTPAHIAAEQGNDKILDLLLSCDTDTADTMSIFPTMLHSGLRGNMLGTARTLLSRGHKFTENELSSSDLVDASYGPRSRVVTFILCSHDHFEAKDYLYANFAWLPVWFLKRILKRLGLQLLLRNLAFMSPCTSDDDLRKDLTAIHYFALCGQIETVQLLMAAGALINMESGRLGTPLMYACEAGRMEVAKLLVRHGALISYSKGTQVFSAMKAARCFPKIVRWILVERFTDQRKLAQPPGSQHDRLHAALQVETYAPATSFGSVPWDATEFIACEDVEPLVCRTIESMQVGPFYCREDGFVDWRLA